MLGASVSLSIRPAPRRSASSSPRRCGRSTREMSLEFRQVITPEQCREARRLLGMDQEDLARAAGVFPETLSRFEGRGGQSTFPMRARLRAALEAAGVEFTESGVGPRPEALKRKRS